jgi:glutamine phosphoribosylpyrophosphate amidotransferase
MVASESVAIVGTGHALARDVAPRRGDLHRPRGHGACAASAPRSPSLNPCMFEYVYLARPDSVMDGVSVYQARLNLGETLAQRVISTLPPSEIDVVIPIPEVEPAVGDAARAADRQALPRRLRQEPLRRPAPSSCRARAFARNQCARS